MAIIWTKLIPRWDGLTIEPPEAKKDVGYIAGDKPPAKWENWLRKGTYEALEETRTVVEGIDSQLAQDVQNLNTHINKHGIDAHGLAGRIINSSGANANGDWIRFDDGTQICTHRINASATANTTGSTIWTFPVSFVGDTMRHALNVSNNTNTWIFDIALLSMSASTQNISANVRYKFSSTQTYIIDLFVIGRWK